MNNDTDYQLHYDLDVQRLFGLMSDDNKIDCINFIFGSNIPHGTPVEWLNRKSVEDSLLETDFVLRIGEDLYHIEVESYHNNKEIGIRMWKYDIRIVGQHDHKRDVEISIPYQVVVYLRTPEEPWYTISTKLKFPDGGSYTYEVPCKYVSQMVGPELIQQAFVFAPAILVDLIGKRGGSETATKDFVLIKSNIDKMLADGRITEDIYKQIIETSAEYAAKVVQKDKAVEDKERGWEKMMSAVGYVEPIKRLEKTLMEFAEASADARAEKKILDLVKKGYSADEIEKKLHDERQAVSAPQV